MMTLYSGTTDPFSQRCRIVLHEKGMDFQIIDVDLDHKPEDLAVMNPYLLLGCARYWLIRLKIVGSKKIRCLPAILCFPS